MGPARLAAAAVRRARAPSSSMTQISRGSFSCDIPVRGLPLPNILPSLMGRSHVPCRFFPTPSEHLAGIFFVGRTQQRRLVSTEVSKESLPNRKRGRRKMKAKDKHGLSKTSNKALTKKERIMARKRPEPDPFYGVNVPALQNLVHSKLDSARAYAKELVYERSSLAKRSRYGPNMDAKWWTVNLIICLLPSAAIALFCEWKRPEMEAFMAEMDEREKKRIFGDDFRVSEENGREGTEAEEKPLGKLEKLKEAVMVLLGYGPAHQEGEAEEKTEVDDFDRVAKKAGAGGDTEKTSAAEGSDSPVSSSTSTGRVGHIDKASPTADINAVAESSLPLPSLTASPATGASTNLQDLLLRIESLERRLDEKNASNKKISASNTNDAAEPSAPESAAEEQRRQHQERQRRKFEHTRQYALKRATAQSGIQNRVDDALVARWEEEEEAKRQMRQNQESEAGAPEKVSMTRFAAEAVKTMAFEYGEEVISAARDYILGSTGPTTVEEVGADEAEDGGDMGGPNPKPALVAANRASASAARAAEMAGRAAAAASSSSPEEAAVWARRASEEASSAAAAVSSAASVDIEREQAAKAKWPMRVWAWGASWVFPRRWARGNSNAEDVEGNGKVGEGREDTSER